MKRYYNLITLIVLFCVFLINGKVSGQANDLIELAQKLNSTYIEDSIKVAKYIKAKNLSRRHLNSKGQIVELINIVDGHAIYRKEFNSGAALTTNTTNLYEGGSLGLNLSGLDLTVGVWDSGPAASHVEFDTRVLAGDEGGNISDHATHVMGTILAKGINPSAKGMAYNARGRSYLWDNDLAEMADFAAYGGILSNHSYGSVLGWEDGVWHGNASVSEDEDYRFGFYGFDAPSIDNIARNAPYYLIVNSAGNDRNDSGPTNPPDGNMGSGFDSIDPASCAKNNLTIGAVEKLATYTRPGDVEMSSFSSWGPTDDGRIKPDIVGAGVGVFSTSSSGEDAYTVKSGTSMSAPNVTGSLLLIQEHYSNLHSGSFMRSSTLKGLVIHTAREAGEYDGPDYSFGWGLLDASSAVNHIIKVDQENYLLSEEQLLEGQVFSIEIFPQKDSKVTATICWIDPAGPTSSTELDPKELRLVNDLDLRIVDDAGNEFEPWILNPEYPTFSASKGDNFRDNVEKIEFTVPTQRKYYVKVSHKNSLQGGVQEFSLILSQKSIYDERVTYYYIGDDDNWFEPNNWSLSSGGSPVGALPDAASNVVFDENSFNAINSVTLTSDVTVNSFSWFASPGNSFDLNQQQLEIKGDFVLAEKLVNPIGNGKIVLASDQSIARSIFTANSRLNNLDLVVNSTLGRINIYDSLYVKTLLFKGGEINFETNYLSTDELILNGEVASKFDISGLTLDIAESMEIQSDTEITTDELTLIKFNNVVAASINTATSVDFSGTVMVNNSTLDIAGDFKINLLEANTSDIHILNLLEMDSGNFADGSILTIADGQKLTVNEFISFSSKESEINSIKNASTGKAFLELKTRAKYCWTNLQVTNVDLLGEAVVSVDPTSSITNSLNWLEVDCNDIIFAEFEFQDVCAGGVTKFTDLSSGEIETRLWQLYKDNLLLHSTADSLFYYSFADIGLYQVKLTVSNVTQENTVTKDVEIRENHLQSNEIIDNKTSLASLRSSENYQWFMENKPIDGANERVYILPKDFLGEVMIYVVTSDEQCNMKSNDFYRLITATSDMLEFNQENAFYPNPASEIISIIFNKPDENYHVKIIGVDGKVYTSKILRSADHPTSFSLENLIGGIYILSLENGTKTTQKRLIIKKE